MIALALNLASIMFILFVVYLLLVFIAAYFADKEINNSRNRGE